jgi:hypothetical protein
MFQVIIKKLDGTVGWGPALHRTIEGAEVWIAEQKSVNAWGKPERWVTALDEDISGAVETRVVTDIIGTRTEYRMPVQYTVETADISAQVAKDIADETKKKKDDKDAKKAIKDAIASVDNIADLAAMKAHYKNLLGQLAVALKE